MFDRDVYFNEVRGSLFGGALTQIQVDGQNVLLSIYEGGYAGTPFTDQRWLAYLLATCLHETAKRMWPITELGSQEYLQGNEYWPYIGRGLIQLTWEDNYRRASAMLGLIDERDLVDHPEVALDSLISARIAFRGMAEGFFTQKKLGDYFNAEKDDPLNARQIINGNDDDELIAGYHHTFLEAIKDATGVPVPVQI